MSKNPRCLMPFRLLLESEFSWLRNQTRSDMGSWLPAMLGDQFQLHLGWFTGQNCNIYQLIVWAFNLPDFRRRTSLETGLFFNCPW